MSYKCEQCNTVVESTISLNRKVIERRTKSYHYFVVQPYIRRKKSFTTESKEIAEQEQNQIVREFNTRGWEIVKEIQVCEECV